MQPHETISKLKRLRLSALAEAFEAQRKTPQIETVSFDERLSLLVDAQIVARENGRLKRLTQEAKLKQTGACIEDIQFSKERELDKPLLRQLSSCAWVKDRRNILISGATGVGKTYLACALAQAALRFGFHVIFKRASSLTEELAASRHAGNHKAVFRKLIQPDILVIDDFGLQILGAQERHDLLDILEERYGLKSNIISSQLPIESWHGIIGDPTIADAICDRLIHNAYTFKLKGPSLRNSNTNHFSTAPSK